MSHPSSGSCMGAASQGSLRDRGQCLCVTLNPGQPVQSRGDPGSSNLLPELQPDLCCRLLLGDRALGAMRRGRWETPAELETRHWESHSFVAHSSCTAVSFKQSLLSVTQGSSRACARRMFSCSVCDRYPRATWGMLIPLGGC